MHTHQRNHRRSRRPSTLSTVSGCLLLLAGLPACDNEASAEADTTAKAKAASVPAKQPAPPENMAKLELRWSFIAPEALTVDAKAFVVPVEFPGSEDRSFELLLLPKSMNPTCDTELGAGAIPDEELPQGAVAMMVAPEFSRRFPSMPTGDVEDLSAHFYYRTREGRSTKTQINGYQDDRSVSLKLGELREGHIRGSFEVDHPSAPRGKSGEPGAKAHGTFVAEYCE